MYEFLKTLFGTQEDGSPAALTFDEFSKKLDANKDIKLANLSEGNYVSKDKFDAKETELTTIRSQLEDANNEIKKYQGMDIESIKKAAADWEDKYNKDTAELNDRLAAQERSHNEEMFLRNYKFSSKAAENGIRSEFVKRNFPFEDGGFIGGKEFMDKLMADDDYKAAFVVDSPEPDPEPDAGNKKVPHFSEPNHNEVKPKAKVKLAELMKQKNENPNMTVNYD